MALTKAEQELAADALMDIIPAKRAASLLFLIEKIAERVADEKIAEFRRVRVEAEFRKRGVF